MPVVALKRPESTDRLAFRLWEEADLDAAYALWGDPEVMRHVEKPLTRERCLLSIQRGGQVWKEHGLQLWALVELETGEVIGCCGFMPSEEAQSLELAYHLLRRVWGRGYASEVARSCLDWVFEQRGVDRVRAYVRSGNQASSRVLEKLGFQYEGLESFEDGGPAEHRYACSGYRLQG